MGLYQTFQKQDSLIKDIERGAFNGGVKQIYLLANDIPKPPIREKYPQTDNSIIKLASHPMTMRYKQTRNSVTFNTPQHKSSTFKTGFVRSSVTYEEKTNKTNELTQSLQVGLDTATEEDIRSIGTNIQAAINDINKDIKALNKQEETEISRIQSMESELERVISERDKGRELYTHHVKNRMETKVVLDSQRRLMDKYIFITEQLSSRPSTANRRPQTASTHRPGTAKDKDTRMNFFSSPNAFTRRPSK